MPLTGAYPLSEGFICCAFDVEAINMITTNNMVVRN
jgi:hypothetical protein